MKLLTLNCHSWHEENQLEKIKKIVEVINKNQYDFVAFQEVSQKISSKIVRENIRVDNFSEIILNELRAIGNNSYDYIWDKCHIGYDIYEEGLAIISRHKLIEKESILLTKSDNLSYWKRRIALKGTYEYKNKKINIYSCHLGWWNDNEEPYKYQVDNIIENINVNQITNIIMGDFNNSPSIKKEGYDYLIQNGLKDTYVLAEHKDKGTTIKGNIAGWEENKNDLRIDLILLNEKQGVKESKVIFNGENEDIVSDHFGVSCIVDI